MWGEYEKEPKMSPHHIGGWSLYSIYQLFWMFCTHSFSFRTSLTEESPSVFWKILCSKNGGAEISKLLSPIFFTFNLFQKWKKLGNDIRENTSEMYRHIGKLRRNWEENQKKILAMVPHVLMHLSSLTQFM